MIPGVEKNTPVNMNGIRIGRVSSVTLVDDSGKRYAEVKLLIRKDRKVYTTDECRISSMLLNLGGNFSLEIAEQRNYPGPKPGAKLKDGELIRGVVQSDFMQSFGNIEGELTSVLQNVANTAKKFETFIDSINAAIGTPQEAKEKLQRFQEIINITGEMMYELNRLAGNVNVLLGDGEIHENIRSVVHQLPDTLSQVRDSLDHFNTFSQESRITLNRISKTFDKAEANFDHLENFTEVLGEEGPAILHSIARASRRLDGALNDISALVNALQNPDGSLGQLLSNPEMYKNIEQTIANVEEISETLKPIVSDFRVFSDKIARYPGVLGVSGAINPGSPLKGLPPGRSSGIIQASHSRFPGGMSPSGCLSWDSDPEWEMIQRQNLVQRALYNASQRQQPSIPYGKTQLYQPGSQSCLGNLLPKLSFASQSDYGEYYDGYGGAEGCSAGSGMRNGNIVYDSDFSDDFQGGVIQQPNDGLTPGGPVPQIGPQPVTSPKPMVAPVPFLEVPQPTDQPLLPTTILEFGPMDDSADPLENGTSATTYPTGDRGYVFELTPSLESPLSQTAQPETQLTQTPEKEIDRSAYAPQRIPSASMRPSQAKVPPSASEPQYGSVRRGIAR